MPTIQHATHQRAPRPRATHRRATRRSQDGYSLLESTVALALLLTVLLPGGTAVYHVATDRHAAERAEALALGTGYLESTLQARAFHPERVEQPGRPFTLERRIREAGDLAIVSVRVYRRGVDEPYAALTTVHRL